MWRSLAESALITSAGFLLALWYMRNRVTDKKKLDSGFIRYFQNLFPIGMMFLGVYVMTVGNPSIGVLMMAIATFVYIVSYITPTVDQYDGIHRATILSLGYTRQEYAIKYLFKNSLNSWITAFANFFVSQFLTLILVSLLKSSCTDDFKEYMLFISLTLMGAGFFLSVFKNTVKWDDKR